MKRLIILLTIIIFSCNTINYRFVEKLSGEEINNMNENLFKKNLFIGIITVDGIFTEKNKNYNFKMEYDLSNDFLSLNFYSILKNELIFKATLSSDESDYEYFIQTFFSVKIGVILRAMKYIFSNYDEIENIYITNDDFKVLVDNNKNFFKYNDKQLLKKENHTSVCRYYYNDNDNIKRIEYTDNYLKAFLIINEIRME